MDLQEESPLGSLEAEAPMFITRRPYDESTICGLSQEDISKVHRGTVGGLLQGALYWEGRLRQKAT